VVVLPNQNVEHAFWCLVGVSGGSRRLTSSSPPSVNGKGASFGLAGGDTKVGGAALMDMGLLDIKRNDHDNNKPSVQLGTIKQYRDFDSLRASERDDSDGQVRVSLVRHTEVRRVTEKCT
jgi:hypothetical protein